MNNAQIQALQIISTEAIATIASQHNTTIVMVQAALDTDQDVVLTQYVKLVKRGIEEVSSMNL